MKNTLYIIGIAILIMSCSSSKKKEDEKYEVKLKFTSTSSYCGGAHPNDKLLEELKTPKTYANKDIFLSTENKLNDSMLTLSADSNGEIVTQLAPRTYYIFLPGKVYTNLSMGGNEESCKIWKNKPDGTFDVEKSTTTIDIRVHKSCDPCGAPRM